MPRKVNEKIAIVNNRLESAIEQAVNTCKNFTTSIKPEIIRICGEQARLVVQ
jgi:hypothetical protein